MKPSVSVLMAVHNGGAFLEESIRSIAAQTFSDWEFVIVDDASTDGSVAITRAWAARDPRVRVIANTTNKGQTASLNEGLSHCRGTWIARQDADDLSHPERLAVQIAALAARPKIALLGAQGFLVDRGGARRGLLDVPEEAVAIAWCAPFLNPFLHTAVVFRRDIVAGEGSYDESYRIAQDYELWTRIAARHRVENLGQRLVSYRYTDNSLSVTGRELTFAEADRVSDREVQRWLGRPWKPEERQLVSDFRKGLEPSRHRDFWRIIGSLEKQTSSPLPPKLRASWHLRLAGSKSHPPLPDIIAALRAAPVYTIRWFFERFAVSS